MKRIMVFWLVLFFPIFVLAKEYDVKDINVKLNIDDSYMVLTRDNLDNNNDLEKLGITKEQAKDIMTKSSIYLDIINSSVSYEILVVVPEVTLPVNNITGISEDLLNSFKDEAAKKVGASVSNIYKSRYNYIVVDYFDEITEDYIVNYYTVVDAKGYNFQLQKKSKITDEEKNSLKEIVDTVVINGVENEIKEEPKEQNTVKSKLDLKKLLFAFGIGLTAGLITYFIGIMISKKKSSK